MIIPPQGIDDVAPYIPDIDLTHFGVSVLMTGTGHGPSVAGCWTLLWMVEGSTTTTINGVTHSVAEGQALLVRPGDVVTHRWGPEAAIRHGYALFTTTTDVIDDWPRHVPLATDDMPSRTLAYLVWLESTRPPGWWSAVGHGLAFVLRMLVSGFEKVDHLDESTYPTPVVSSLRYVAGEWANHSSQVSVALPDLARSAGVTAGHLCRVYAQQFGMSPIAALRLVRLKSAATLLSHTDLSVAEISRLVGFGNEFHFSRSFKEATGGSPSSYRRDGSTVFELAPEIRRMQRYLTGS